MGKKSIYAMKEDVLNLFNECESISATIEEKVANPNVKMDELTGLQAKLTEAKARHDMAAGLLKNAEDKQRAQLMATVEDEITDAPKAQREKNLASFYRAAARGDNSEARRALAKLGAIPENDATLGYGENLLPSGLTNQLIHEPFDDNPMRAVVGMSNVTNLEMPKIAYTIDDDSFITDKQTAKEMALEGDRVSFGRFKTKVMVKISDTVLRGTDTNLVGYVNNALASGLATKEKKCMFALAPSTELAHMSFYAATNGIETVTGATLYEALITALGDLPDAFAERAQIVMRRADYLAMIKYLANENATLWGAKPQDILGVPVVFCDLATTPVIGDFGYYQLNYDIGTMYDSDKDVESGDYIFVLTAWFDMQFLLKSAFRLVEVDTETP